MKNKWCIKLTSETEYYINLYSCVHKDFKYNFEYIISDQEFGKRSIVKPSKEYPEITLEQFKKHILKESTTMKNLLTALIVMAAPAAWAGCTGSPP